MEEGNEHAPQPAPLERRHPELIWVLDRFHLSLDLLREMLADFVPLVEAREKERLGPQALAALESLDPDRQEKLRHLIEEITEGVRNGQPIEPTEEEKQKWAPLMGEIFQNDRFSIVSLLERMRKKATGPSPVIIVHNSLLAQAIAAFEVLVSGVVTRFFVTHPSALGTAEKEFSLADLRTFADIDDAADALIANRVGKLMYGGLDDWADWFQSNCDATLSQLAMSWNDVVEAFQRRHVVIHNGGLVSRQYLARVPDASIKIGDRLAIDHDYLANVFDQLDVLGTVLVTLAWGSWRKDERNRSAGRLLQRSYELMLASRWAAADCVCKVGATLKCSAEQKESIKVNGWNSRLELHGLEDIRSEVEAWDVSAAADRFRLAKLVLSGDLEAASKMTDSLLKSGELTGGQLNEWPVLRTLREFRARGDAPHTPQLPV
jgi:hypothetical protein